MSAAAGIRPVSVLVLFAGYFCQGNEITKVLVSDSIRVIWQ